MHSYLSAELIQSQLASSVFVIAVSDEDKRESRIVILLFIEYILELTKVRILVIPPQDAGALVVLPVYKHVQFQSDDPNETLMNSNVLDEKQILPCDQTQLV